jgi:hypothetical protein
MQRKNVLAKTMPELQAMKATQDMRVDPTMAPAIFEMFQRFPRLIAQQKLRDFFAASTPEEVAAAPLVEGILLLLDEELRATFKRRHLIPYIIEMQAGLGSGSGSSGGAAGSGGGGGKR